MGPRKPVPQTSPKRRYAGNEHTKGAVSVIASRSCAAGNPATKMATPVTTRKMTAAACGWRQMSWNHIWLSLLLAAVGLGAQFVTCNSEAATQLTTSVRSILASGPMTTPNDLITTASSSKATAAAAAAEAGASTASWDTATSSTAPTIPTTTTSRKTKSTQIGLTAEPTTAAASAAAAAITTATATTAETLLISTIHPTATTASMPQAASSKALAETVAVATATATTEADANNSIETSSESAVLLAPHPGSADSLTKGFSIPTFLPPFPVFAAADLPAYRAAAAAAEAAEREKEAAAAALAASTAASEMAALSPEQRRQQMFNEQHLYLAEHIGLLPGQLPRRNLTMPVLNVTVQLGNHAYMPCQIHRLSDKPVSWVRLSDGHIISVDETTFIGDERFQSIYQEDHDYTWSLQIKYAAPADAGWYECQMATEPKLSAKVHLDIVTPKTELIGDQSRFVKAGSKVALHCIVRGTLDPPKYIIWFRGQKKVSESDDNTGWYTQIDRNIFGNVGDNQNTIGSLIIPFVRKEDSGNYTCQPSNSVSVSVDLHVLSGEYSASAIMSTAARTQRSTFLLLLLALALCPRLLAVSWAKT